MVYFYSIIEFLCYFDKLFLTSISGSNVDCHFNQSNRHLIRSEHLKFLSVGVWGLYKFIYIYFWSVNVMLMAAR